MINNNLIIKQYEKYYVFSFLHIILFLFLSCKSNKQPINTALTKQEGIISKKTHKDEKSQPKQFTKEYVRKVKNKLLKKFKIWEQKILSKLYECHEKYTNLKNIPCKPEKIVEVKEEKVYVFKTINFKKYKKILEKKLSSVKSLKTRGEIAEKLFFINLAEKNWTKAYDLYKIFIEHTNQKFYDLMLAFIYFNNAEETDGRNILNKYQNNQEKKIRIKLVKFSKKIISYGIFEPKSNALKKGGTALLYILLDNVENIRSNNDFKANLSIRISINRKKEKFVLLDEENHTFTFKHPVNNIMLPIRLHIPLDLSYNYYYMKVDITDINSNKSDSKLLKVKIVE